MEGRGVTEQLIDTGAIAAMLGVSRQHVTDRLTKQPTFPRPAVDLSQRLRRWDRAAVLAWLAGSQPRNVGGEAHAPERT